MTWSPTSWQEKDTAQQPSYVSEDELLRAEQVVASLPPLVSSFEIEALKARYARQYSAMESTVAQFKETGNMLTSMLEKKD